MRGEDTDDTRSHNLLGEQLWVGWSRSWSVFRGRPQRRTPREGSGHCPYSQLAALHGAQWTHSGKWRSKDARARNKRSGVRKSRFYELAAKKGYVRQQMFNYYETVSEVSTKEDIHLRIDTEAARSLAPKGPCIPRILCKC